MGFTAVHQLGWDFFKGWQEGAPYPIDTTAGGVAAAGVSYACGFVPGSDRNGADAGACYLSTIPVKQMAIVQAPTPGRTCLERGGFLSPSRRARCPARQYRLYFCKMAITSVAGR